MLKRMESKQGVIEHSRLMIRCRNRYGDTYFEIFWPAHEVLHVKRQVVLHPRDAHPSTYTHTHAYVQLHPHTHSYIHMHTRKSTYMCANIHIHIPSHTQAHTYTDRNTGTHIGTHTHTHINTHTHIHTHTHTHIFTCKQHTFIHAHF